MPPKKVGPTRPGSARTKTLSLARSLALVAATERRQVARAPPGRSAGGANELPIGVRKSLVPIGPNRGGWTASRRRRRRRRSSGLWARAKSVASGRVGRARKAREKEGEICHRSRAESCARFQGATKLQSGREQQTAARTQSQIDFCTPFASAALRSEDGLARRRRQLVCARKQSLRKKVALSAERRRRRENKLLRPPIDRRPANKCPRHCCCCCCSCAATTLAAAARECRRRQTNKCVWRRRPRQNVARSGRRRVGLEQRSLGRTRFGHLALTLRAHSSKRRPPLGAPQPQRPPQEETRPNVSSSTSRPFALLLLLLGEKKKIGQQNSPLAGRTGDTERPHTRALSEPNARPRSRPIGGQRSSAGPKVRGRASTLRAYKVARRSLAPSWMQKRIFAPCQCASSTLDLKSPTCSNSRDLSLSSRAQRVGCLSRAIDRRHRQAMEKSA